MSRVTTRWPVFCGRGSFAFAAQRLHGRDNGFEQAQSSIVQAIGFGRRIDAFGELVARPTRVELRVGHFRQAFLAWHLIQLIRVGQRAGPPRARAGGQLQIQPAPAVTTDTGT